jgi:hypothetical protein
MAEIRIGLTVAVNTTDEDINPEAVVNALAEVAQLGSRSQRSLGLVGRTVEVADRLDNSLTQGRTATYKVTAVHGAHLINYDLPPGGRTLLR